MIDLDIFDQQLEQALTEEVRVLRGTAYRPAPPPPIPAVAEPARMVAPEAPWEAVDPDSTAERWETATPAPRAGTRPAPARRPPTVAAPAARTSTTSTTPTTSTSAPTPSATATTATATSGSRPLDARLAANLPLMEMARPAPTGRTAATARPARTTATATRTTTAGRTAATAGHGAAGPGAAVRSPDVRSHGTPRTHVARPAGPTAPASTVPTPDEHAARICNLLSQGRLEEADQHIAAHALISRTRGDAAQKRDAAALSAMRAMLDGRRAEARASLDRGHRLGLDHGADTDPRRSDAAWLQRFWFALEWGGAEEQDVVLDHARGRAYRNGDVAWRCALTLQLARLGRADEAGRELDASLVALGTLSHDGPWADAVTNLAEATFLLGNSRTAAPLQRLAAGITAPFVVAGIAVVWKGSLARYHAHLASAGGHWAAADAQFANAVEQHRVCGAAPLLARTLREWGWALGGRDDARAHRYLEESATLARRLQLAGFDDAPGTRRAG